jgi:hypothetical protein
MDGDRRGRDMTQSTFQCQHGGSRLAVQGAGDEVPGTVRSSSLTVLLPWAGTWRYQRGPGLTYVFTQRTAERTPTWALPVCLTV